MTKKTSLKMPIDTAQADFHFSSTLFFSLQFYFGKKTWKYFHFGILIITFKSNFCRSDGMMVAVAAVAAAAVAAAILNGRRAMERVPAYAANKMKMNICLQK